jgi:Ras-related protein Rab-1A
MEIQETPSSLKTDKSQSLPKTENIPLDSSKNSKNQSRNKQYIFKIILIGDCNIGKTCIISRYVTNYHSESYICTIGVDFMMKSIIYDDHTIKLQIWDTAGMEKYKQITSSYYRGTQAAIICFDLTNKNSFNSIERWYSDFSQFYNPIFEKIVILVGNKSDLIEDRVVSHEEIENLCRLNRFEYYETSAKTGENIESLFDDLAKRLFIKYKNNMDAQIRNAVHVRKSTGLYGVDKYQSLITWDEKKKKCC